MKRILGALLVLCLMLFAVVGGVAIKAHRMYEGTGPLLAPTTVTIPKGSSLISIAKQLEEQGIIYNKYLFRIGAELSKKTTNLKAGIYDFPVQVSSKQALDLLILGGREENFKIVIPEGLTIAQIFDTLSNDDRLKGELPPVGSAVPGAVIEINNEAKEKKPNDETNLSDVFIMPDEGYLLPETYFFSEGDSKISIVERMRKAMRKNLDELWNKRDPELPLKNKEEALTLASLVERETYKQEEKPVIASVFYNRLNKSMRLQTDPTVIYALSNRWGKIERPLSTNDYKIEDPYNTYRIDGLPPGPICNPGVDAIKAVLHPAETNYFFFVADGTGRHKFAETFVEHKANRQKWLKIIHKRRQALNDKNK